MPFPTQTFNTTAQWKAWVDTNIIPNGTQAITGNKGNITENAAIKFISQSYLNWDTAQLVNTTGSATAASAIVVFVTNTPALFTFGDNVYNEYRFINTTSGDIPLGNSMTYFDINLTEIDSIPAKSVIGIVKATNGMWIIDSLPSSGSQPTLPPLIGIVGQGGADDPTTGSSTFQSNKIKNLGAANGNKISINLDGAIYQNYGINTSFTYNATDGEIDLDYNSSGNNFQAGSALTIDLNQ
jgi:hypothetical protein